MLYFLYRMLSFCCHYAPVYKMRELDIYILSVNLSAWFFLKTSWMVFSQMPCPSQPYLVYHPVVRAVVDQCVTPHISLPDAGEWQGAWVGPSRRIGCSTPQSGMHTTSRAAADRPDWARPLCTRVSGSDSSRHPTDAAGKGNITCFMSASQKSQWYLSAPLYTDQAWGPSTQHHPI